MTRGSLGRFGRLFWNDLPLINFVFFAVAVAATEQINLSPPRCDLAWTFIFPLIVPLTIYALRWWNADPVERFFSLVVLLGALSALALISFAARPDPFSNQPLRRLYEFGCLANTALLGLHAWRRGSGLAILFFAPVAAYGAFLENGGIILGYFSERDYYFYLGPLPAPLSTMAGWILVFYLVMSATWELQRCVPPLAQSAIASAVVATAFALCLDLQVDPLATAVGLWRWNDLLPPRLLGVPVHNFVAWASAALPFSYLLFRLQRLRSLRPEDLGQPPHRMWLWSRIPLALSAAALLFFGAMAAIEKGFSGPTFAVLKQTFRNWGLL